MAYLNRQQIAECLEEFSSREMQVRLWLSDGSNGREVSSFTEAVCGLFDDSGLGDALEAGESGLGSGFDSAINQLDREIKKVDSRREPAAIIDDPAMAKCRELAGAALGLIKESNG